MHDSRTILFAALSAFALLATVAAAATVPFDLPLLWPEEQRAFVQDGPGWLLSDQQLAELLDRDAIGRRQLIESFLARDPVAETPVNELTAAIAHRRALVASQGMTSYQDERARILFLNGEPEQRHLVDCAEAFRPLEIWTYGAQRLVLYRPAEDRPWRLWLPLESKRVLYVEEMEYWLEQWEELRSRLRGRRFDRSLCDDAELIDEVTGVDGLFGFRPDRPKNADLEVFLAKPSDLRQWSEQALAAGPEPVTELLARDLEVDFPKREGQRMVSRFLVVLPAEVQLQPVEVGELREVRLTVSGQLMRQGRIFETLRVRFQMPPPEPGQPIALLLERRLRPGEEFLARLQVVDEQSDRRVSLSRGFSVPAAPSTNEPSPELEQALLALGEQLREQRLEGEDSLVLFPPDSDVIFGLWRAEALVTGNRISKVVFLLDGTVQLTRRRPPFTAELRLPTYPTEQVVRVEGYDEEGELLAADEVVINQPRGELQVRITEPGRGATARGQVLAKAEVVVPEERQVETVEFSVDGQTVAEVTQPPWQASIEVPGGEAFSYLTVTAELDDGSRAEDVRFLNAPGYVEEVDVNLVELYTTVTDGSGRLARGLSEEDFRILEMGQEREIVKFELVEDLPLTLGIAIDTSGSMVESLGEAQRAAVGFLESMITPKDRCFALAFADRPSLLMARTSDVGAVANSLEGLVANGATTLHDALVTSLYYYRGIRGRRALVVLSDGEDTASSVEFRDALEYARRSGVSVFTIGLRIGRTQVGVRRKLENLAQETGGRTFYIQQASDLAGVYAEIEAELRSQYLLAFSPSQGGEPGEFREVEVEVKKRGLRARTARGYYY